MIKTVFYSLSFLFVFTGTYSQEESSQLINNAGKTILNRYKAPQGFELVQTDTSSFAYYLQNLPLKAMGKKVKYYNGNEKANNNIYISVVEMEIDAQDLQQCADAVMRLKAEYHYHRKEYDKIHFNFISDGKARYYKDYVKGDYSYKSFRRYMRYIFSYANTASLFHELDRVINYNNMQIGDIFIQKGNPYGHAVIVVNMAVNNSTGEKLFMLAQSYMPAQETQVLVNRNNMDISPWYELKVGKVYTPEWEFYSGDLKRFKE